MNKIIHEYWYSFGEAIRAGGSSSAPLWTINKPYLN